jgi:hypothetical protein
MLRSKPAFSAIGLGCSLNPSSPVKWLAEFWKLEKEAEKMLVGLAK